MSPPLRFTVIPGTWPCALLAISGALRAAHRVCSIPSARERQFGERFYTVEGRLGEWQSGRKKTNKQVRIRLSIFLQKSGVSPPQATDNSGDEAGGSVDEPRE